MAIHNNSPASTFVAILGRIWTSAGLSVLSYQLRYRIYCLKFQNNAVSKGRDQVIDYNVLLETT